MRYPSLNAFTSQISKVLPKGAPVAMVFVEDGAGVETTVAHLEGLGFGAVAIFGRDDLMPEDGPARHMIPYDINSADAVPKVVNAAIRACPGTWMHYCFNAEYLYYPFCETRTVGEMAAFSAEERRSSILTYVVDLYAPDLSQSPNAVNVENAYLDRAGYYALGRATEGGNFKELQLDFFGGLRWRFEEHVPADRRRIDRIALFQAKRGLSLLPDHTFSDEDYNTYACPWHHNITAALCSFRTAKALMSNPGSMNAIDSFMWKNSEAFQWNSNQLMELGLMEPGQWF